MQNYKRRLATTLITPSWALQPCTAEAAHDAHIYGYFGLEGPVGGDDGDRPKLDTLRDTPQTLNNTLVTVGPPLFRGQCGQ